MLIFNLRKVQDFYFILYANKLGKASLGNKLFESLRSLIMRDEYLGSMTGGKKHFTWNFFLNATHDFLTF